MAICWSYLFHQGQNAGRRGLSVVKRLLPKTWWRRILVCILPVLIVVAVIIYGYAWPSSQIFGKVDYKGSPSQKVVALTFDDGPNDPYTSQILDILEQYNVKATFFEVGRNVELYPQTTKRVLADGDIIGNHSYSHNANHALTEFGVNDLKRGETAIYNVTGVKPRLYRPPHGKKSPWELDYLKNAGMVEVNWTVESPELAGWTGAQEAQYIINKTHPGDIIILHDGYGLEHNDKHADKGATVEAVGFIVPRLEAEGYIFVTVPELLHITPYLN